MKEDNYKYLETLGMGVMIDKKMAGEVLVLCEELGLVYCSTSRVYICIYEKEAPFYPLLKFQKINYN